MRIIHDLHRVNQQRETVLTIGAFDGLHLGHQELLRRLIRRAQATDRRSAVLTFDPLPRAVLDSTGNAICLISAEDKIRLLEEWGLELLVVLPFTAELANTSAREFVQTLCQHLHVTELWVGWDFALGRGRSGDVRTLRKLGEAMGFLVQVVEPVRDGQAVVSSTAIRNLISQGCVREAAEMLGRCHEVEGLVVPGDGRGRDLGFPTANLQVQQHCAIPGAGVYAVYVAIGDERYSAVANIGFRPTFGAGERTLEVHVLDFRGNLYGDQIRVQFVQRLRAERRFPNAQGLCAQIKRDIASAREILR